jgi:DNA-binding CsgD family transcriptional regulator
MAELLVGRDEELQVALVALDELPAAVVFEGEPGIGKTILWQAALAELAARGSRVLSARPAETESSLSYVGLVDVLDPVLDEVLPALPSPQRRALEIALQRADAEGGPPEQSAIAFAVLSALRATSQSGPVVVAIDDLQWLDRPSAFALAFAASRLREEPVGLLFTLRREGVQPLLEIERRLGERLQRVAVGPLSLGALHHLVQIRLAVAFSRPTLQRVHATSGGNPFFALELARAVHERGGEVSAGQPLPVPNDLSELLRARIAALPPDAAEVLLAAASLSSPIISAIAAVVGSNAREGLEAAAAAEVIELDGEEVRFAHPLLASAVYFGADARRRRAIHAQLAASVNDAEERARHLALSVTAPDTAVAEALDQAAEAARRRGAAQVAADLTERALELTPSDETVSSLERELRAGALRFEAGETARARTLFAAAAEHAPAGPKRASALSRLARVYLFEGDRRSSVDLCRRALAEVGDDLEIRSELEEGLAVSYYFMRENLVAAAAHARSAVEAAREFGGERALAEACAAKGLVEGLLGRPSAADAFDEALKFEPATADLRVMRRPSYSHAVYLFWTEDLPGARARFETLYRAALDRGDESSLPLTLAHLSEIDCLLGLWEKAARWADEGVDVATQTAQGAHRSYALAARALVNAYRGNEELVRVDAGEALALAQHPAEYGGAAACAALGLLELSRDDARAAYTALAPLVEKCEAEGIVESGALRFVPDEVEALVMLGEADNAVVLLESAQRRAGERRAARETLEQALTEFDRLGASMWAERTRRELRRISGRAASRTELTATERRVAELVAEGMTNREVAAALYVTPRTVEGTLSRIYAKLGIRSRTELARRLTAAPK